MTVRSPPLVPTSLLASLRLGASRYVRCVIEHAENDGRVVGFIGDPVAACLHPKPPWSCETWIGPGSYQTSSRLQSYDLLCPFQRPIESKCCFDPGLRDIMQSKRVNLIDRLS